jgi:hypothetical protein
MGTPASVSGEVWGILAGRLLLSFQRPGTGMFALSAKRAEHVVTVAGV